jgi:hypothetical protein
MAGKKGKSGGARPGAGAPRGMRKKTIERMEQARLAEVARAAELEQQKAKAKNTKLAKEVIEEFMFVFAGMAAYYQPTAPGALVQNEHGNPNEFERWAKHAVDAAAELAKYQSPTFKAVAAFQAPTPPALPPPGQTIEGKVIRLDDPVALQASYLRMVKGARK